MKLKIKCQCGLVLVLFFPALVLAGALPSAQYVPDRWIVELEAPATLHFDAVLQLHQTEASAGKQFASTAPRFTGQSRFDAGADVVRSYAAFLDQQRERLLQEAADQASLNLEPLHVYRHLTNGFSVRMDTAQAERLSRMAGVKSVRPVAIEIPMADAGPQAIGADLLWSGIPGIGSATGEGVVIGLIDSGINWNSGYFSDQPAHSGGHSYSNPLGTQLGLCSDPEVPCNNKLIGVYDFTSEGTKGFDLSGHGSHIASVAAGNARNVSFAGFELATSGVAPHANIVSYKVCETVPATGHLGCAGDNILAALEQAIIDGVDVVNYSMGGSVVSPWEDALDFLGLWSAGISLVAAAGNGSVFGTIPRGAHAPWALAIGSSTHQRWFARHALIAVGNQSLPIRYGSGPELAEPFTAPLVAADSLSGDLLACQPFPFGSLGGSVLLAQRGGCSFLTKRNIAAAAGARALLLIDTEPGLPVFMSGLHGSPIPAASMGLADGMTVLQALDDFPEPTVSLDHSERLFIRSEWADMVAPYSSRGPSVATLNTLKPNLVAPGGQSLAFNASGSAIVGADAGSPTGLSARQGSSMAVPNVVGAIALLRELRPDWDLAMLRSTLETTARIDTLRTQDGPAGILDRGAGRVQVDQAANAGLYLPVSVEDFLAADPADGGEPMHLNLAGILGQNCAGICSTTRTVRALHSGHWEVVTSGELAITVSPESFSLEVGQEQALSIQFALPDGHEGAVADGSISLIPTDEGLPRQQLVVGMTATLTSLLWKLEIDAERHRGGRRLNVGIVEPLDEAVFATSGLIRPQVEEFSLAQDPTPGNPFDGAGGAQTFLVDVPDDALMLIAETVFSTSPDLDLFVGRDLNDDGQAQASELVCASTGLSQLERCLIKQPQAGRWWVLVQNWEASGAPGGDEVQLEMVVLTTDSAQSSLVASGKGRHPGGPLLLDLYWDQPAMRKDERWLAALAISSAPDQIADIGSVLVEVTRGSADLPQPTALFAGQSRPVVLPPNASHEMLFVDVPAGATRLQVTVQGEPGVNASIRSAPYDDLAGFAPGTPPPASAPLVSGTGSANGINLNLGTTGSPIAPARYFVVLHNDSNQERLVDVTVELVENQRLEPRFGLWSPKSRLIFQGIEWQRGGPGFMIWYSYDDAGLPIFYIAVAEIDPTSSVWRANLERVTGNNIRQTHQVVGEVALTSLSENEMVFAWRLNGAHGSEIMTPDAPQTCPEIGGELTSLTGHWFSPSGPVGGTTVIVIANGKVFVRYYYDGDGVGRWVFVSAPGGVDELGEVLEVRDFRGFCPNCPAQVMSYDGNSSAVGFYEVEFDGEDSGFESLDFINASPLGHGIELEVPIMKLSERLSCEP